jgi:hypothetical protein
MIFREPVPFEEALQHELVKRVLPTSASADELSLLAPEIRRRARFSARVQDTRILARMDTLLRQATEPQVVVDPATGARRPAARGEYMDQATFRLRIKETLRAIGYEPQEGEAGTIKDLLSRRRQDVIFDTNVRMAHGYGQHVQGQDPAVLDEWPAQELVREANWDAESRGTARPWTRIWQDAGGQLHNGRMIALKNDEIWVTISRFGLPYPPFDYGSGMGVQDVDRDTAMEAGLIGLDEQVTPNVPDLNADLSAELPGNAPAWLVQQVRDAFEGEADVQDGRLVLAPRAGGGA